jgi:hypothetical protein
MGKAAYFDLSQDAAEIMLALLMQACYRGLKRVGQAAVGWIQNYG